MGVLLTVVPIFGIPQSDKVCDGDPELAGHGHGFYPDFVHFVGLAGAAAGRSVDPFGDFCGGGAGF